MIGSPLWDPLETLFRFQLMHPPNGQAVEIGALPGASDQAFGPNAVWSAGKSGTVGLAGLGMGERLGSEPSAVPSFRLASSRCPVLAGSVKTTGSLDRE